MMQMPKNTHPYMRIIYILKGKGGASVEASRTGAPDHTGRVESSDVLMQSPVSNWRSICQSELN